MRKGRQLGSAGRFADKQLRIREDIEKLERTANKTRLKNRARLEAALVVSQLYGKAIKQGARREDLEDLVGARLEGRASPDFRFERWMLPKHVSQVTGTLLAEYDDRHEPQRRECVYYRIVRVMCEFLREDCYAWQVKLMEVTGRDADETISRLPFAEVEPAERVAGLLQDFARAFGVSEDLAALWDEAQRLGLGWNVLGDPVVAQNPVTASEALPLWGPVQCIPPYPLVRVLQLPLYRVDAPFDVWKDDEDYRNGRKAAGSFTQSLDLCIAVAPDGRRSYAAFLGWVWRHHLQLQPAGDFPGFSGRGVSDEGDEEISDPMAFNQGVVKIVTSDNQVWWVEGKHQPEWEWIEPEAPSDDLILTSQRWSVGAEEFCNEIARSPSRLRYLDAGTLARLLGPADQEEKQLVVGLLPREAEWSLGKDADPGRTSSTHADLMALAAALQQWLKPDHASEDLGLWFRSPGPQRLLERSLHNGSLWEAFKLWTASYRTSLEEYRWRWHATASEAEERLRRTWSSAMRGSSGLDPERTGDEG